MATEVKRILVRGDTQADWTNTNPILAERELGYETDTGKLRIGDGETHFLSLNYVTFSNPSVNQYLNLTPSGTATYSLTPTTLNTSAIITPTGGTYTYTLVLTSTNAVAGSMVFLRANIAGAAITINVKNLTSGGSTLWQAIRATVSDPSLWANFTFDGTNWIRVASGYET